MPQAELPGRVTLVRGYLRYVLDALPGTHRTASFQVIAGTIARTPTWTSRARSDDPGRRAVPQAPGLRAWMRKRVA